MPPVPEAEGQARGAGQGDGAAEAERVVEEIRGPDERVVGDEAVLRG